MQPPKAGKAIILDSRTEVIRYDNDTTIEYFGFALPGTSELALKWKIMRITYAGEDWILEWADGNSNYDNVWHSRLTLEYS